MKANERALPKEYMVIAVIISVVCFIIVCLILISINWKIDTSSFNFQVGSQGHYEIVYKIITEKDTYTTISGMYAYPTWLHWTTIHYRIWFEDRTSTTISYSKWKAVHIGECYSTQIWVKD